MCLSTLCVDMSVLLSMCLFICHIAIMPYVFYGVCAFACFGLMCTVISYCMLVKEHYVLFVIKGRKHAWISLVRSCGLKTAQFSDTSGLCVPQTDKHHFTWLVPVHANVTHNFNLQDACIMMYGYITLHCVSTMQIMSLWF